MISQPPFQRPLWTCPQCGHQFVTANLWHSCVNVEIASHFAGKAANLLPTFERFVQLARECGEVTIYAQKTRIVIQARVRFAGAVVRKNWLDAAMWLKRRADHPRLSRIEDFGRTGFGHHFRLSTPEEIDPALAALMREAYQIGIQATL
jgi:uncharacterized protein DUF5655